MNLQVNIDIKHTAQTMVDGVQKSNPRLHAIAAALLQSENWQEAIDLIDYVNDLLTDSPASPMMGLPKGPWDATVMDSHA